MKRRPALGRTVVFVSYDTREEKEKSVERICGVRKRRAEGHRAEGDHNAPSSMQGSTVMVRNAPRSMELAW